MEYINKSIGEIVNNYNLANKNRYFGKVLLKAKQPADHFWVEITLSADLEPLNVAKEISTRVNPNHEAHFLNFEDYLHSLIRRMYLRLDESIIKIAITGEDIQEGL
jgi:hypothetical protein